MQEATKAAFRLLRYDFAEFSFREGKNNGEQLSIGFRPKGVFSANTNEFTLTLTFVASEENVELPEAEKHVNPLISVTLKALFKFEPAISKEEIPNYFYKNAIAILFPYIRAFISTLTLQANQPPLILPLMNLSRLEQPLLENTTFID